MLSFHVDPGALDGRYLVREGNSRTVAVRHVADQHPGNDRYSTLPAMVFDQELTEDDLAVLLADMIRWDAYEQAKQGYSQDTAERCNRPAFRSS